MPRYFLHLAYNGAPFHGWQTQPNAVSVQQTLEQALATVMRLPEAKITGAGRTDAGVSARCMVAHFDLDRPLDDPRALCRALNSICGPSIVVYDIIPVADDAHARFDATARTYRYFALDRRSPFFYPLAWNAPAGLDYDAMNRAAELLLQTEDFTSFAKLHSDAKTNICHVSEARWTPIEGASAHQFTITADRFLRNMVRAVVGTLVEVGRGKMDLDGFQRVIDRKDRCSAGTSMPAQALYLWDVQYPYYQPNNPNSSLLCQSTK